MSWGWKGPLEIFQSNPSAQAGSDTAGCSGVCPVVFWDLQWWKLHAHPVVTRYRFWSPSCWKHHLVFKLHFLHFNLCSIEKSGSATFTLHHLILIQAGKISLQPSFLQFGQLFLPLPMCQILLPHNNLCSPSLDWLQHHQPFPALGAQVWTQIHPGCVSAARSRGQESLPSLVAMLLMLPRMLLAFAAEAQSWLMVSLSPTHSPLSFCETSVFWVALVYRDIVSKSAYLSSGT